MPDSSTPAYSPEQDHLSTRLAEAIPLILDVWEERVRSTLPAARHQEPPLLRDHIPALLLELARGLAPAGSAEAVAAQLKVSREHGEERARSPHYSLQQVLSEYRLLWRAILEVLEAPAPMAAREREVIGDTILRAMQDAGAQYVAVQQLELKASQGRLIGIQVVTDAALAHLPLEELLDELLARVSDLLTSDTAAILLADEEGLRVRAARGLEEAVQAGVRIPLGAGFAGRIATTREPLIIEELTPDAVVNPLLREKRIRSLLGVPLVVEGQVTGVLHVGSRLPAQFTREDAQLLQLVADRVALGIDRARIYAELQEANDRRNQFLAMVAHELRTPLSAISNALYILGNIELPDERAGRQLVTMGRQARQLTRLVEDLMDISRIRQGRIELRKEPVVICRIVSDAVEAARPLIEFRGQDLLVSITHEHLLVDADADRLEQVVANLLNNAAKYTEPGGRIWVTVEREGDEAVVRVKDTGMGIDPPLLPQVFDLFHQADPGGARSQGGLGIGLALAKRLVQLHGGSIEARSEGSEQGSEFVARLPLVPTELLPHGAG